MSTDDEDRLLLRRAEVNGQNRGGRQSYNRRVTTCAVSIQPPERWQQVRVNPTYYPDALSESEGQAIRWHSPSSPRSSQVFCISAFGSLRHLPDGQNILQVLLTRCFPNLGLQGPWQVKLEHFDRNVLDETGRVTPTSVDVFCQSTSGAVCIESKFIADALEGFGRCSQFPKNCRGFYGPGSDSKTGTAAHCRLEVPDGQRGARSYWRKGRPFFREDVFWEQAVTGTCPFRDSNFQLMRNVLFAASSGAPAWATLAIVPSRVSAVVQKQAAVFRDQVLLPEYWSHLAVATYEDLVEVLRASRFEQSQRLGEFLAERMARVCSVP